MNQSDQPLQNSQPDQMRPRNRLEDEIELMDYLRVIWKWKYLIVAGTLICAVAAGVISFSMPKVYRISMVLRPGMLTRNEDGNAVYVDSPHNIKAIIEAGAFDREILGHVRDSNNRSLKSFKFKVNIPRNSNAIKIFHETVDVNRGLQMLDRLGQLLLKNSERVEYFQNEYETQIDSKKVGLSYCEAKKRVCEQRIKNVEKRIEKLTPQIELVRKNTASLIQERDKFLSNNTNESNMISTILYMNTIQHNISLENSYRQEIDSYVTRKEDEELEVKELNLQLNRLVEEIKDLEFKKNNVKNIEILQPPTRSPHPIKPKIKLNVMLATVVGLFAMLFLAFFVEYIQRHRGEIGGKVK